MERLNLGAGGDIRPASEGWVNADVRSLPGIDVVCDARGPLPFGDGAFDELVAQDLLEHIPPSETQAALAEWTRVLKPGGVLRLRFPDLVKIATKLVSGAFKPKPENGLLTSDDVAVWLLYGDQSPEWGGAEWGSHKTGFTAPQIEILLKGFGYYQVFVARNPDEMNLYVTAVRGG